MAESVRIRRPPPPPPPRSPKPRWILSSHLKPTPLRPSSLAAVVLLRHKHSIISTRVGRIRPVTASSIDGASIQEIESAPVAVELLPICSEDQFHRIVSEAQEAQEPVIVVWMASWCRKCIYLKPKLEKLAAEYHPRLRFFCVDVNKVSHKLVAYAGITKMPVIQLWKNGLKQAEVIGGHKAHLVVNEVRDMTESGS